MVTKQILRFAIVGAVLTIMASCVGEFPGRIVECGDDGYCKFLADDDETWVSCKYSEADKLKPQVGTRGIARTSRGYPIPFGYNVQCPELEKDGAR